ncbi:hypothetical protein HGB07_04600 [Candidatus Roizmanbacteria bacterium]|nr:hypothetical protein [Candidatus Roizmanbacteria bacterium]
MAVYENSITSLKSQEEICDQVNVFLTSNGFKSQGHGIFNKNKLIWQNGIFVQQLIELIIEQNEIKIIGKVPYNGIFGLVLIIRYFNKRKTIKEICVQLEKIVKGE